MINEKKAAFIWDLDGTLLNSYGEIVSSTQLAFEEFGIDMKEKEILDFTIMESGKALLEKVCIENKIAFDDLHRTYLKYHHAKMDEVVLAPNAEGILKALEERRISSFVFTHRGKSTLPILKRLNIDSYFKEIITMEDGFARKPAPDANLYLMEKYHLDQKNTCFVGDRQLDMQCAANAGLKKILYIPEYSVAKPSGIEDYVISDFMQILYKVLESGE